LYRHLTKLTESPAAVAPNLLNAPNNTANNLSACRRPPDKNLAHLLNQPTSSFPFARPTYRGGFWSPRSCWPPLSKTAVLVPYRNRSENLDKFVPYMQTLLQQQNIAYGIFVIEQANTKLFNRAKLLNVGFRVAQQFAKFDCFVLHDADKVPENVGNIYDCVRSPKLMISAMRQEGDATRKYHRGRMYNNFLGGSAAISKQAFERVNGNSNRYYGWGREDDELASRLGLRGMQIFYPRGHVARFVNLKHSSDVIINTMPWPHWSRVRAVMNKDGLNSLNYTDKGIYLHNLFVLIRADL
uniref:Glyco_transf_7N domain-containing protein n=1 Tax=Macrostomum lignano TaxID=282301 RepID=A0A1I8HZA8_9PLAT